MGPYGAFHLPREPTKLRSVTHTGSLWANRLNSKNHLLLEAAQCGLVCENSQANCVCVSVCECMFGSGQSQDTDGRNGVSRSASSGQITPMLFLLGSLVGGHRQSRLALDYLTAGHRMKQQGSNTETQQLKSAALLLISSTEFP